MRALGCLLLSLLGACRLVAVDGGRPIAPHLNHPDRVVVLYVGDEPSPAADYHNGYVALEKRLLSDLAHDPRVLVRVRRDSATACRELESHDADYIVSLHMGPDSRITDTSVFCHSSKSILEQLFSKKGSDCDNDSFKTTTAFAVTMSVAALQHGRRDGCRAIDDLSHTWRSASVDGTAWQPLVAAQVARAGVWMDGHLAHYFRVDTRLARVHGASGEIATGGTAGVRPGDTFSLSARGADDGWAIATAVTPATTTLERLTGDHALTPDERAIARGRPWVLEVAPRAGMAWYHDDGAHVAPLIGAAIRVRKMANGPIFGLGFDDVVGDHHWLLASGAEVGWRLRASQKFDLHALGEASIVVSGPSSAGVHTAGGGAASAVLGATWNEPVWFATLEAGYSYSTVLAPDPTSRVDLRGPLVRLTLGFSLYH